jgi:hypothetical protein
MQQNPATRTMVLALAALCMSAITANTARAEGGTFEDLTLQEAWAKAAETGQTILIEVSAAHCMACGDVEREIWESPEGAALAEDLICIRFDSTTPEGQALNQYYPITGLPVVIFVRPDSTEIDRVVGYTMGREKWLEEAELLKTGYDPLPDLEEELAANPGSVRSYLPVLERYLYRFRDAEAESLLMRILELDPKNQHRQASQALIKFAKHARLIWHDMDKSYNYWKMILERFPDSPSVSGAVSGTYQAAMQLRRLDEWKEWICKLAEDHPESGRLQYSLAMNAKRGRLRGACFAKAARTARALGAGPAFLDTLAVELEGGEVPGKK